MAANRVVTLKDISAKVGVNITAVSMVLNGNRSSTRVSEATRLRIVNAAHELDYRPNAVARSLRQKRMDMIGIHTAYGFVNPKDPFMQEVLVGLTFGCMNYSKDLAIFGTSHDRPLEEVYTKLVDGKIDGLVLLVGSPDDPLIDRLAASFLPVVVLADTVPALSSVVADDVTGARMQLEYLAAKGHRTILYRRTPALLPSLVRRYEAFFAAAKEAGVTVIETFSTDFIGTLSDAELSVLNRKGDKRPTAAVCCNDAFAHVLMSYCLDNGVSVPNDLAVMGFDGGRPGVRPAYRLTTIEAHWQQAAETAISVLVAMLNGGDIASETIQPVELTIGDTA